MEEITLEKPSEGTEGMVETDLTNDHSSISQKSSSETEDIIQNSSTNNLIGRDPSEDDETPKKRVIRVRVKRFSDSDSDSIVEKTHVTLEGSQSHKSLLESDCDSSPKYVPHKSRIQRNLSDSDESSSSKMIKNNEQQLRMKNKRSKLRSKFENLITSRGKEPTNNEVKNIKNSHTESSNESGDDISSIDIIKQKIKDRMSFKSSICDPDTSDEETVHQKPVYKKTKAQKMTKPTSPKPLRMSAKQAMENMQKIKSESNRMLREKEVSLPYHRPKALSLKDIMSRRKPALSCDGKAFPIKMNEEQLRQYVKMLEERQKEMIELCKSESEEEIEDDSTKIDNETDNENKVDETLIVDTKDNPKTDFKIGQSMQCLEDATKQNDNQENTIDADNNIPQDQESDTSMQLVYNDSNNSIDDKLTTDADVEKAVQMQREGIKNNEEMGKTNATLNTEQTKVSTTEDGNGETAVKDGDGAKPNTAGDSQLISLHFDTENTETIEKDETETNKVAKFGINIDKSKNILEISKIDMETSEEKLNDNETNQVVDNEGKADDNEFSDDDFAMADIDNIIENAEIIKDIEDTMNSQFLVRDKPLNLNPKLTGAPGMVIDLDVSDTVPRKSGVELLKDRFTYFCKLKSPDEREKKLKPGIQLKKLKQELEEEIAEQRSLEWAKRLDDEKQHQNELKELRGEQSDDDLDKIEAALEGAEAIKESEKSESEQEEEPIEDDVVIKDKPRAKNAMLDDEAEESDCDDENNEATEHNEDEGIDGDIEDGVDGQNDTDSDESDSSDSEEEQPTTKKGRILKAFEDSDDEDKVNDRIESIKKHVEETDNKESESKGSSGKGELMGSQTLSQDEEIQLAQRHASESQELFTSLESALLASEAKQTKDFEKDTPENEEAFTQTFSILDSSKQANKEVDLNSSGKMSAICDTQSMEVSNLDDVVAMYPVTNSQNNLPLPSQIPITLLSQSQEIGEDIVALCTGQFYNNQFVSQMENLPESSQKYDAFDNYNTQSQYSQDDENNSQKICNSISNEIEKVADSDIPLSKDTDFIELNVDDKENRRTKIVDDNLNSILDELRNPEFDTPKPNKYFGIAKNNGENDAQLKKRFVIDSDDEALEGEANETKKSKKRKKKKLQDRALQISDDEEISEEEEVEAYESDIEEENPDRVVEYDSEENEIQIKPQNPKKKRKMAEFFENEAELTSEDEWVGSGDEDEAGLDRMEREEGDDDTFHQGQLERELGEIHMREVLDQDKRDVRLIQELLFEDGDLGAGGRQRKFRWNNIDANEETGTVPDEFADTQEEEFESEEQWRKQRHERETFLRQMKNKDQEESPNVSVNRSSIIKANLLSKTMSSLLMEVNGSNDEKIDSPPVEKKNAKDIPSPQKPFALLQQTYQGSLLSRGRGALARLAALATPLAADDDAKVGTIGPSSKRNFVFAAITPDEKEPKVTMKRKAESNQGTPMLVKKMRKEDKQNASRSSLLDHFKV